LAAVQKKNTVAVLMEVLQWQKRVDPVINVKKCDNKKILIKGFHILLFM
jgi:hypothetical protein